MKRYLLLALLLASCTYTDPDRPPTPEQLTYKATHTVPWEAHAIPLDWVDWEERRAIALPGNSPGRFYRYRPTGACFLFMHVHAGKSPAQVSTDHCDLPLSR